MCIGRVYCIVNVYVGGGTVLVGEWVWGCVCVGGCVYDVFLCVVRV